MGQGAPPAGGREAPRADGRGPLEGLRVVDAATLFAGPLAATMLGDFGAEVIKIEHPRGDPVRNHGHQKDGVPLWWKMIGRNKRAVSLDLSRPEGQVLARGLLEKSDVLIENFRPDTLERWNLGPDDLWAVNPRLVIARVTGFGQIGPYRRRPGFGTLAEALSGFAALTGEPDGPPTLPPFGLADGIAALAATSAIMFALRARETTGRGQVVDLSILEPILTVLGPQPLWYDQLGIVQERRGNRSVNNAPRNTYRTKDGRWVAVSTSSHSVAERVLRLIGYEEVTRQPWFRSGAERAQHADLLDDLVGSWIAERPLAEVMEEFEKAQAAVAPIYDIRDVMEDPQLRALDAICAVEDEDLGTIRMQNVMFRLSETPGRIRWAGRRIGRDNTEVYGALLGLDAARLDELVKKGII
jgi:crotonobetainyl-CoA:carnitine CoA-transferase CaiB-like acyl-CoA transferase